MRYMVTNSGPMNHHRNEFLRTWSCILCNRQLAKVPENMVYEGALVIRWASTARAITAVVCRACMGPYPTADEEQLVAARAAMQSDLYKLPEEELYALALLAEAEGSPAR